MSFTITNALRWWARECPDQSVMQVDGEPCTFAELYGWSGRVGEHLAKLGVKAGDRVCMVGLNSLDYAVLAFGLLRIGAIGAPVSFRSTERELADAFDDLTPTLCFADPERHPTVQAALGAAASGKLHFLGEVRALRSGAESHISFTPAPDAPVFIIGTSGSTARPKGVIYTHRTVLTYASELAIMEPKCARGSKVLSLGPFSSSSGYLLLLQFASLGATLYIESQFRPERALALLTEQKITTFQAAPIFFERITALPGFAGADLSSLHFAQVGGARVNATLLQAWLAKGVTLRQAYGSTEAGGGWAARDDAALTAPEKCGRGGIFTEYRIAAADGETAEAGVRGEILIRSACLMAGYWNNPDATASAVRDGWLRTGDLGMIDEAGNLTFVDRLKEIIISGGLNISAAEVEGVVAQVEGVDEVAVIAASDPDFGETPLCVVYGDPARLSVPAIIEHCNRHLTNYKVPRYVVIESEPLPRLPSGKLSKPAIRERYRDAAARLVKVR
jgi:fatty-acyl-CoA synthase